MKNTDCFVYACKFKKLNKNAVIAAHDARMAVGLFIEIFDELPEKTIAMKDVFATGSPRLIFFNSGS